MEQIRLTPAEKKRFELQHPKSQVIKKTDLVKVRNTWLGHRDLAKSLRDVNVLKNYLITKTTNVAL